MTEEEREIIALALTIPPEARRGLILLLRGARRGKVLPSPA